MVLSVSRHPDVDAAVATRRDLVLESQVEVPVLLGGSQPRSCLAAALDRSPIVSLFIEFADPRGIATKFLVASNGTAPEFRVIGSRFPAFDSPADLRRLTGSFPAGEVAAIEEACVSKLGDLDVAEPHATAGRHLDLDSDVSTVDCHSAGAVGGTSVDCQRQRVLDDDDVEAVPLAAFDQPRRRLGSL